MVAGTSEVANLLERLEERYDRENREGGASDTPLSHMVEEFLQGLDSDLRMEGGGEVDMDDIDVETDLDLDDDPEDEDFPNR